MQEKQVVAALEGIASITVEVEFRTSGDENPLAARAAVELARDEISAVSVLVELVEHPQFGGRQLTTQNPLAMFGNIPVQVACYSFWKALGERGLPDLPRPGDE